MLTLNVLTTIWSGSLSAWIACACELACCKTALWQMRWLCACAGPDQEQPDTPTKRKGPADTEQASGGVPSSEPQHTPPEPQTSPDSATAGTQSKLGVMMFTMAPHNYGL